MLVLLSLVHDEPGYQSHGMKGSSQACLLILEIQVRILFVTNVVLIIYLCYSQFLFLPPTN